MQNLSQTPQSWPGRTGIIGAMHAELSAVLELMPDEHCQRHAGRDFWVGHWHGHEVVAVLCGVGKVAAATTASALIERFGVQRILFTGTAGGLGPGVRVGDVVLADDFVQHDMDARPLFPRFEVPLTGRARFGTNAALRQALHTASARALANPAAALGPQAVQDFQLHAPRLHTGLIASGDRFIATQADSDALRAALPGVLAVEMEGAAIAQVCHDHALPYAALRTISDRADDSAHVDFNRFIEQVASRYSVAVLDAVFAARKVA